MTDDMLQIRGYRFFFHHTAPFITDVDDELQSLVAMGPTTTGALEPFRLTPFFLSRWKSITWIRLRRAMLSAVFVDPIRACVIPSFDGFLPR